MAYTSESASNSLAKHGVRSEGGPGDKKKKEKKVKKAKKAKSRTVSANPNPAPGTNRYGF